MQAAGQAAIVTGGGSGLGAATARALVEAGARVALLDVNLEGASAMAREIGALAVECDVTDAASTEAAITRAREAHGAARICVSCAGIATAGRIVGREGPLPLDAFKRVVDVNLIGTFNVMRLSAADMIPLDPLGDAGERGVIINTASVAAFEGQIGQAAYSASKGGVASLTLPAARELARFGVRVLTIAPGLFETPMLLGMPKEVQESLAASIPFPKRLGKPGEYAALVMHLVGNAMMNGATVRLDGAIRLEPK